MSVTGSQSVSLRPSAKPLVLALLIALAAHAVLFALVAFVGLSAIVMAGIKKPTPAQLKQIQAARQKVMQEAPLLFVETDPSQTPTEAPKNPKFYSSHNSRAANPDTRVETDVPKIDGTQIHVPKAETTTASKAMPLQPAPPKNPTPETEQPDASGGKKPGDLAMAKPISKPDESKNEKEAPVVGQKRPRTVAEARQQQSALTGQKMKQDGGVQRQRVVPSFDAVGSPFGDYDAKIIAAIQQRWYDLLSNPAISEQRTGRVVVEFRLNYDGRISDLRVVDSDVGDLLSYLCLAAIKDPSPYEHVPMEMRRLMDGDSRLVRFTFFYD